MEPLTEFEIWLENQYDLASNTRRNYIHALAKVDLSSPIALRGSLTQLKKKDMDKTFNSRIDALKSYKLFLEESYPDSLLIPVIAKLKRLRRIVSNSHKPYTYEETQTILKTASGWRWQCLYIAFNAGLRREELRMLNVGDIDFLNNWIIVRRGKGNKMRRVAVADMDPLKRWKKIRGLSNIEGEHWLFSRKGTRPNMSSGGVFQSLSRQTGIKITLHRCRATFATELYRKTNDPMLVMEQLGHSDLSITQKYIQQFSHERSDKIKKVGRLF